MISKGGDGLRLIPGAFGVLALLVGQTACAGLISALDRFADVPVDGTRSEYSVDQDPQGHGQLTKRSDHGFALESGDGGARRPGRETVYLAAELSESGALSGGEFRASLDGKDISELLEGSLADMGPRTYTLLANEVALPDELADRYGRLGIPVRVRVANPKGTGLMDSYATALPAVASADPVGSTALKDARISTPRIPAPGTLVLLLAAAVPLAASVRRR